MEESVLCHFLNTEAENKILELESLICPKCRWKMILFCVKEIKTLSDEPFLENLISTFTRVDNNIRSLKELEEKVFDLTVCYVANQFLCNKALLSFAIHKYYVQECIKLNSGKFQIVNNLCSWSRIGKQLQDVFSTRLEMHVDETDLKLGTMLLWKRTAIKGTLHKILFDTYSRESCNINCNSQISMDSQESVESLVESMTDEMGCISLNDLTNEARTLENAANILRSKIKAMTQELENVSTQTDLSTIDLKYIVEKQISPEVWNFLLKITMSDNEANIINELNTDFKWTKIFLSGSASDKTINSRNLKRLFALSVINFIVSSRCNFPFHIILSELIDK